MIDTDKPSEYPHITIYAPAETLTCRICGKDYVSRGKNDPGICRDCEKDIKAKSGGGK